MSKLLPNLPIENLTEESDYIGIIEKGTILKSFFLNNKNEFSRIKIFSIYGEWGSGKSTLMKYLQKELKGSFNTFFYESWEFESDNNLAKSLLEYLVKNTETDFDNFLENGNKLLKGFAKSITLKTPIANFNVGKAIEEGDNFSFYELKEQFKRDFIDWENKITECDKCPKYNIVFIDDLDRCEPENILNLLSAMKLFFTYGEKTIFLCGIDKKAIREAVKTKYGEIVKANEYLEKIFDISFSMPETINTNKLINSYFDDNEKVGDKKLGDLIHKFFEELHFKNPRRIKKILNKYLIIKRLKESEDSENLVLPNIIYKISGTLFETYLTLYLLILNEFEPEVFKLIFNFSAKKVNYAKALKSNFSDDNNVYTNANGSVISYLQDKFLYMEMKNIQNSNQMSSLITLFTSFFTPIQPDNLTQGVFSNKSNFMRGFGQSEKKFEYYFTLYIFDNWKDSISKDILRSNFSLMDYKKMISNLI